MLVMCWMILKNAVDRKEMPENENATKLMDIVEKILKFNK